MICSKETSFILQSMKDHRKNVDIRSALVKDGQLCQPLKTVHLDDRWHHLEGIELAEVYPRGPVGVDILIGSDYCNELLYGIDDSPRFGGEGTPTAIPSIFGYLLQGPADRNGTDASVLKVETSGGPQELTDDQLKKFQHLEEVHDV